MDGGVAGNDTGSAVEGDTARAETPLQDPVGEGDLGDGGDYGDESFDEEENNHGDEEVSATQAITPEGAEQPGATTAGTDAEAPIEAAGASDELGVESKDTEPQVEAVDVGSQLAENKALEDTAEDQGVLMEEEGHGEASSGVRGQEAASEQPLGEEEAGPPPEEGAAEGGQASIPVNPEEQQRLASPEEQQQHDDFNPVTEPEPTLASDDTEAPGSGAEAVKEQVFDSDEMHRAATDFAVTTMLGEDGKFKLRIGDMDEKEQGTGTGDQMHDQHTQQTEAVDSEVKTVNFSPDVHKRSPRISSSGDPAPVKVQETATRIESRKTFSQFAKEQVHDDWIVDSNRSTPFSDPYDSDGRPRVKDPHKFIKRRVTMEELTNRFGTADITAIINDRRMDDWELGDVDLHLAELQNDYNEVERRVLSLKVRHFRKFYDRAKAERRQVILMKKFARAQRRAERQKEKEKLKGLASAKDDSDESDNEPIMDEKLYISKPVMKNGKLVKHSDRRNSIQSFEDYLKRAAERSFVVETPPLEVEKRERERKNTAKSEEDPFNETSTLALPEEKKTTQRYTHQQAKIINETVGGVSYAAAQPIEDGGEQAASSAKKPTRASVVSMSAVSLDDGTVHEGTQVKTQTNSGIVYKVFDFLSSRRKRGRRVGQHARVNLPDSVLFANGTPRMWYSTNKDGTVQRRVFTDLTNKNIYESFTGESPKEQEGNLNLTSRLPVEAVSMFSYRHPYEDKEVVTTEYFDKPKLLSYVINRKNKNGVLQKNVETKGFNYFAIRVTYFRDTIFLADKRTNIYSKSNFRVNIYDKMSTFDGPEELSVCKPINHNILLERLRHATHEIVSHIEKSTPIDIMIKRVILNFTIDRNQKLWFLYCSFISTDDPLADEELFRSPFANFRDVVVLNETNRGKLPVVFDVAKKKLSEEEEAEERKKEGRPKRVELDDNMYINTMGSECARCGDVLDPRQRYLTSYGMIIVHYSKMRKTMGDVNDPTPVLTNNYPAFDKLPKRKKQEFMSKALIPPIIQLMENQITVQEYLAKVDDKEFSTKAVWMCESCYLLMTKSTLQYHNIYARKNNNLGNFDLPPRDTLESLINDTIDDKIAPSPLTLGQKQVLNEIRIRQLTIVGAKEKLDAVSHEVEALVKSLSALRDLKTLGGDKRSLAEDRDLSLHREELDEFGNVKKKNMGEKILTWEAKEKALERDSADMMATLDVLAGGLGDSEGGSPGVTMEGSMESGPRAGGSLNRRLNWQMDKQEADYRARIKRLQERRRHMAEEIKSLEAHVRSLKAAVGHLDKSPIQDHRRMSMVSPSGMTGLGSDSRPGTGVDSEGMPRGGHITPGSGSMSDVPSEFRPSSPWRRESSAAVAAGTPPVDEAGEAAPEDTIAEGRRGGKEVMLDKAGETQRRLEAYAMNDPPNEAYVPLTGGTIHMERKVPRATKTAEQLIRPTRRSLQKQRTDAYGPKTSRFNGRSTRYHKLPLKVKVKSDKYFARANFDTGGVPVVKAFLNAIRFDSEGIENKVLATMPNVAEVIANSCEPLSAYLANRDPIENNEEPKEERFSSDYVSDMPVPMTPSDIDKYIKERKFTPLEVGSRPHTTATGTRPRPSRTVSVRSQRSQRSVRSMRSTPMGTTSRTTSRGGKSTDQGLGDVASSVEPLAPLSPATVYGRSPRATRTTTEASSRTGAAASDGAVILSPVQGGDQDMLEALSKQLFTAVKEREEWKQRFEELKLKSETLDPFTLTPATPELPGPSPFRHSLNPVIYQKAPFSLPADPASANPNPLRSRLKSQPKTPRPPERSPRSTRGSETDRPSTTKSGVSRASRLSTYASNMALADDTPKAGRDSDFSDINLPSWMAKNPYLPYDKEQPQLWKKHNTPQF